MTNTQLRDELRTIFGGIDSKSLWYYEEGLGKFTNGKLFSRRNSDSELL